jgi:hypothetical protein
LIQAFILILHLTIITILAVVFYRNLSTPLKDYYWPALSLKLFCGIAYGLLYLHYFGYGDTLSYFRDGLRIAEVVRHDLIGYLKILFLDEIPDSLQLSYNPDNNPRAYWTSKTVSPLLLATGGNYWISGLYLSFFSFFGTYFLANTLLKIYAEEQLNISISFFFFPSFAFWSAGLTKESIGIGGLFFMIGLCLQILNNFKTRTYHWLLFLLFFWFVWKIRFFYLAVFLLTIGFYTIMVYINRTLNLSAISRVSIAVSIFLLTVIGISQMDVALHFLNFTDLLVSAYESDFEKNPSNAIKYFNFQPKLSSILINSPIGLISGLFRPSLIDVRTVPMAIVALENLVLLLLFIFKLKSLPKERTPEKVMWAYIIILATFLALSSPNFGTLTRYKVAFLPMLLFLLLKDNKWMLTVGRLIGHQVNRKKRT